MLLKISQPQVTVWFGFLGFFVGVLLAVIYIDASMPSKSWLFALATGIIGTLIGHFIRPKYPGPTDSSSKLLEQVSIQTRPRDNIFSSVFLFLMSLSLIAFIPCVLMLVFTFFVMGTARCDFQGMVFFCFDIYTMGLFSLVTGGVTVLMYFLYKSTVRS